MNGIIFVYFLPYVLANVVAIKATKPHRTAKFVVPPVTSLLLKLPIALLAKLKPIIATVGPITTGGINLSIQLTPAFLTTIAIIA